MTMMQETTARETPSLTKQSFLELFGDGYCILLPLLDRSDDKKGPIFSGEYTIVSHEWEVLIADNDVGQLSMPGLCD